MIGEDTKFAMVIGNCHTCESGRKCIIGQGITIGGKSKLYKLVIKFKKYYITMIIT